MMARCFLRSLAGAEVDLFDQIVSAERRGDVVACRVLAELDRLYESKGSPPESGTLTIVARDEGWFERDMPHGLWSVG